MFIGFAFYDRAKNSCVNFFGKISIIVPLNDKSKPLQALRMGQKIEILLKRFATSATDHIRIIFSMIFPHMSL